MNIFRWTGLCWIVFFCDQRSRLLGFVSGVAAEKAGSWTPFGNKVTANTTYPFLSLPLSVGCNHSVCVCLSFWDLRVSYCACVTANIMVCVCVVIVVLFCAFEYVCFNIWVYFSVWGWRWSGGSDMLAFVSFSFFVRMFCAKAFLSGSLGVLQSVLTFVYVCVSNYSQSFTFCNQITV